MGAFVDEVDAGTSWVSEDYRNDLDLRRSSRWRARRRARADDERLRRLLTATDKRFGELSGIRSGFRVSEECSGELLET